MQEREIEDAEVLDITNLFEGEEETLVSKEDKEYQPTEEEIQRFIQSRTTKKQREDAARTKAVEPASEIHRNDPCICGSGKKYKKCCGA